MKKRIVSAFLFLFSVTALYSDTFYNQAISDERLKMLPVPMDFRNYFLFQSINDSSFIIIADFTGEKRLLARLNDEKSAGKVDSVTEYFPDQKKFRTPRETSTEFFKGMDQMKRDIIDGKIFRENYSYKMKSLDTLKYKLEEGSDVFKYGDGYSVKFYDPDEPSTIMCEFYFSKVSGRYDLIFKTNYYKIYKLKIVPPLVYSVYCKNSRDPVVAETVESLLKIVPKK